MSDKKGERRMKAYGQEMFDKQMFSIQIEGQSYKEIFVKVYNSKEEYSILRIRFNREVLRGDDDPDIFLYETTGYEIESEKGERDE